MRQYACNTEKPATVLTVTQLDSQKVLAPENLENRDNILVIYKNINDGYSIKPISVAPVKAVVEWMKDNQAAFIQLGQKEPAAEEPSDPGTTDPANSTDGEKEENKDGGDGN